MWFFRSPEIVFGEDALDYLPELEGRRALIVTDENIVKLGLAELVVEKLRDAEMEVAVFDEVEPNPSLETAKKGASVALDFEPDWIVGLGGGSCMDTAKSVWIQYERPDLEPDQVSPAGTLGLGKKAKMIAIPTTSGTGAETTWPIVLTDTSVHRKISVGHPENIPNVAIVDPALVLNLPPQITADTGMDALTHAIEGYTALWHNDFSDGMCLQAIRLVFRYLPRAYEGGAKDPEAREHMHNAATIAGLGFGNSMAATAHALGHSLGALFPIPHGRAVGLFLPYTIEFAVNGSAETRYGDIASFLGFDVNDEQEAAEVLVREIRNLARRIGQPLTLEEAGIGRDELERKMEKLVDNAQNDGAMVVGTRFPSDEETEKLYWYAYEGKKIDF